MQDWWKETFPKGRQTLRIIDANGYPVNIAYGEKGTGKPLFLIHGIGKAWNHGRHAAKLATMQSQSRVRTGMCTLCMT